MRKYHDEDEMKPLDVYEGYEIWPGKGNCCGMVRVTSGKEVPDLLKGHFTSATAARKVIDEWLRTKKPRVERPAPSDDVFEDKPKRTTKKRATTEQIEVPA